MNANARAFVPQNMSTRTNTTSSPSISRVQRSSGRNFVSNQSSLQPEVRKNNFRNQNFHSQGDQNARLNVNRNNPRRKQNRHSYHHHNRNQLDDVKNSDRNSSSSSTSETDINQAQETDHSVDVVETNLSDLSLNDPSYMAYGAPNRRGQISLNHLLNFSFPPRQSYQANTPRRQRTVNYQPYNKERFLNANFRFLVKSMGDYTAYQVDPDILLNWEDIEQVIITSPNTPSCPICLQQPTAARVTKCGHTFCLACIIHYLQLNDENEKPNKKWRKCPICWDSVYAKDLKSVRFWAVRTIGKVGDGGLLEGEEKLTMRLIQRPMNSTIALPRSPTWPLHDHDNNINVPWHFTPNALTFSKLMLASFDYLQNEYNHDLKDLKNALQEAHDWNSNEEIPFIEMAIVNVEEHLEALEMFSTKASLESERRAHEILEMAELDYRKVKDTMESLNSVFSVEPEVAAVNIDNKNNKNDASHNDINNSPPSFLPDDFKDHPHIANISPLKPDEKHKIKTTKDLIVDDKTYYYYQSEDGQHIYLNPLDIRVLKQEFGTYDNFPDEITVRIVGVDESTMNEELRKRFKYISHLPLSCDVTFLEVDLKGFVTDDSLKIFENELKQRYNRRKEKARKEEWLHEQAVNKERRSKDMQQESISSDPFFQPYSYNESTSSNTNTPIKITESSDNDNRKNNDQYDGPRTVWGTPAVSFANVAKEKDSNEQDNKEELWNLPEEEIYVGKKHKKKKLVLMSTGGKRQR
ncbi:hypothetical protein RhiirA5_354521 [Rhizophagus irregularis]|uniref:RING-type domain-containing protein n=3 Tax=Rhizophagus irregularis TaxID=588596 RepID=A0A2I1F4A5_9GLOM|nr:hypothetical protein GLOIN_2v1623698 [Rhizophagus irregularis DAOM 181602=DAOM 197198]EXX54715.1 Mag2p [Rhizophagus irregularis DAOM 197198w]PKC11251.1 hypothetical protein RhiirA5_354521 [Rhizophagus irregularis]PKY29214.1 hypothetical protein RhiirB3_417796 [Rhizophagus irregularis]POG69720.1 hypothetical protein GLOIN_2v1623698 [Rhizophagus irregularis DAOM 181602=DAOM 197198]UZO29496.1 hypothetical protein OCT59_022966 [Rhizophagus irregularis]|eukprot:XP_025176586.1 hypothetical protein GLOIN_2v1623698 [Rhizophagus irregularis DAOM 181602=DAOM 197198]